MHSESLIRTFIGSMNNRGFNRIDYSKNFPKDDHINTRPRSAQIALPREYVAKLNIYDDDKLQILIKKDKINS